MKIKYNGNGAIAIPFKDAFTAQITEKEVKPRNGSALIKSADIPLGNRQLISRNLYSPLLKWCVQSRWHIETARDPAKQNS